VAGLTQIHGGERTARTRTHDALAPACSKEIKLYGAGQRACGCPKLAEVHRVPIRQTQISEAGTDDQRDLQSTAATATPQRTAKAILNQPIRP